jgi:hypothetical protein
LALEVEADGDVRAVGVTIGNQFTFDPLLMRWDGTQWAEETSPYSDEFQALLDAIAIPDGPRWVVGFRSDNPGRLTPLVIRCG